MSHNVPRNGHDRSLHWVPLFVGDGVLDVPPAPAGRVAENRRFSVGTLYLCTCWTGFSLSMSIVDWLQYVVMKPDEDGYILV